MITPKNYHYIQRIAKRTLPFLKKENRFTKIYEQEGRSDKANEKISQLIQSKKPFMVARFGSTESAAIINYIEKNKEQSDIFAIYRHLKGDLNIFRKQDKKFLNNLCSLSGFFPNDEKLLSSFVDLMIESAKNLDVLGIWNHLEEYIPHIPENTFLCKIRELEPWFYNNPWSQYLEGKKILVIHPFEGSIRHQYAKNIRGGICTKISEFCHVLN